MKWHSTLPIKISYYEVTLYSGYKDELWSDIQRGLWIKGKRSVTTNVDTLYRQCGEFHITHYLLFWTVVGGVIMSLTYVHSMGISHNQIPCWYRTQILTLSINLTPEWPVRQTVRSLALSYSYFRMWSYRDPCIHGLCTSGCDKRAIPVVWDMGKVPLEK